MFMSADPSTHPDLPLCGLCAYSLCDLNANVVICCFGAFAKTTGSLIFLGRTVFIEALG